MPWLAVFVYLIARGKGMQERAMVAAEQQKASTDAYIKNVAAQTKTPAEQIADAQGLLDSGAITQQEFDSLKAKALALTHQNAEEPGRTTSRAPLRRATTAGRCGPHAGTTCRLAALRPVYTRRLA